MAALRSLAFVITALSAPALMAAGDDAAKSSPFLPPAGVASAAKDAPTTYTLAGMTVVSGETLLSITRESDKRSTWIPVGKTVADITVVSFDAKKDEAVIRAEGRELTLPMRKAIVRPAATPHPSVSATTLPAAAPAPAAPAEPLKLPAMNQQEEKEMEARMLVSDLLEIGQQQRRAYEAAQREAAAKAAADSRAKAAQK